jgi:hypothetical protein
MRQVAYAILSGDVPFTSLIPAGRIVGGGKAHDPPDLNEGMWCMVRMLVNTNEIRRDGALKGAASQRMQLWVYDRPGSFEDIDRAHRVARQALLAAPPRTFAADDGPLWLQGVEWEGDSQDLPADEYGAITRNAMYRLVGSGI